MTEFVLIRHGTHDLLHRVLTGRGVDVGLNDQGFQQATHVAECLHDEEITRILSSPRRRAIETTQVICRRLQLPFEISALLDEIDAGDWTGMTFDALANDPRWAFWNRHRGSARPPRGESMAEIHDRILSCLKSLQTISPRQRIALVSHAEPIRAVLLRARHIPFDQFMDVPVEPASVHTVMLEPGSNYPKEIIGSAEQRGAA